MFHPSDHHAALSEEEFRLLRDFIHERFGLWFDDTQRPSLRSRLAGRLASLDLRSYEDYYRLLRFSPQRHEELDHLVGHITNNETYFFREQAQLELFAGPVLRELREARLRRGERELRLASAGCSTGEEPLTLAMLVFDSGQFFWNWHVQILGLDVDNGALERARRGLYHPYSFRGTVPALRERHFVREARGFRPREVLRRMVEFRPVNLLDAEAWDQVGAFDAIFCRNVLIYFSDGATERLVRFMAGALRPGGYLFLGHAESLARVGHGLEACRHPGALVYRRPLDDEEVRR